MSLGMEGKVAIITGAGRGIGRAAGLRLAGEGVAVLVNDLEESAAQETAAAVRSAGGRAEAVAGDVTAPSLPEALVRQALQAWGGLDILVNNAGYTWDGTLHKMTDTQWQAMLDVHLTAPFRLLRAAAPFLRETAKREIAEGGRARPRKIVNISSTSGTRGNFGQANYAAAKAGVMGLTRTLAREWAAFNIQVNAVAFGLIETRLTAPQEMGGTFQLEGQEIALGIPSGVREEAVRRIPAGRPGTPEEAAGAILFFASPLSDYVSGQVLEVAGGA
jgi:3-oxoacyl-[acyl-carrier protein] reductase